MVPRFRYLTYAFSLVGAIGTVALMAYAGQSLKSLLSGFTPWAIAPYAVFAAAGAIARTRAIVVVTAFVSLAAVLYAAFAYVDVFFVHIHSTGALVFIFVPLYQLVVAALVLVISLISLRAGVTPTI